MFPATSTLSSTAETSFNFSGDYLCQHVLTGFAQPTFFFHSLKTKLVEKILEFTRAAAFFYNFYVFRPEAVAAQG
jgi:hypothetical protein